MLSLPSHLALLLAQILDGSRPAKKIGRWEFIDILRRLCQDIKGRLESNPDVAAFFNDYRGPRFVFDTARAHVSATRFLSENMVFWQQVWIPRWSPDFNKPVEHAHGTVKQAFKHGTPRHRPLPPTCTMADVKQRITDLVQELITVEHIQKDVATVPTHWRVVASKPTQTIVAPNGKKYKGSAGDWPNQRLC